MSDQIGIEVLDTPEQPKSETATLTPELLLAQIVAHVGEEFVIIPTGGWMKIVETIRDYQEDKDDNLLEILEGLGIPVIPVSLAKKEEESRIIMPTDAPQEESRIIMP